jgi:hypothetical protein
MYALIPDTLDVGALLMEHPPNIPHFTKEKLVQLISLICKQANSTTWKVYDEHTQIMSRQFLSVAHDYLKYISYLERVGVLSKDYIFRPGKNNPDNPKSIGYKLIQPHDSAKLVLYDLSSLPNSDKRIYRKRSSATKRENGKKRKDKSYDAIRRHYPFVKYLDLLEIDMNGVHHCMTQTAKRLNLTRLSAEDKAKANLRYSKCLINLTHFQMMPSKKVVIDNSGHRLHSPLTQMKKEFRYFLSYEGEKLVSLDLRNSQPFLSTVLLDPDFWGNYEFWTVDGSTDKGKDQLNTPVVGKWFVDRNLTKNRLPTKLRVGDLYPEFKDVLFWGEAWPVQEEINAGSTIHDSLGDFSVGSEQVVRPEPDGRPAGAAKRKGGAEATAIVLLLKSDLFKDESVTLFRDLVAKGLLYEELVKWLEKAMTDPTYRNALESSGLVWNNNNDKSKRNVAKALLVRAMFGPKGIKNPVFQIANEMLESVFPLIHQLYSYIKKGNHKAMARLLQRIESFLILKACTQAIRKTNKRIPIWTIHDSIVTIDKHVDVVKTIMGETIKSYVGARPSIEVDYWKDLKPREVTFLQEEPDEVLEDESTSDAE